MQGLIGIMKTKQINLIKVLRAARGGMTQAELAAKAELGRVTLLRIENGIRSAKADELDRIAGALGVSPRLIGTRR